MFAGERLRGDLRELQRLCADMRLSVIGGRPDDDHAAAHKSSASALLAPPSLINAELLQAVHEREHILRRTLAAGGLLLRAMEALPRPRAAALSFPAPLPCRCVSRPAQLSAAPLVALLWAQVCQLGVQARAGEPGDAAGCDGDGPPATALPSRGYTSCASQTEDSCLRRCEACCVAEAAVKALVQAFCAELEEPSVAETRSQVATGLCPGLLSQWGAMRALTSALCRDLDDVLRNRGAALAALEVERTAASQDRRDAAVAFERARAAEAERSAAESARQAADGRVAELEAAGRDGVLEKARLAESLEEARRREADLLSQLQAARTALDQVGQELQQSRRQSETLKAEHGKLRKQVKMAHERQALLLRYPDLHGPLQPLQHEAGDPVLDMECQVQANEVRVALLTHQNERLRATIAKLRVLTASGRPPTRNHSRPTSASSPCPSPLPSSPCLANGTG